MTFALDPTGTGASASKENENTGINKNATGARWKNEGVKLLDQKDVR